MATLKRLNKKNVDKLVEQINLKLKEYDCYEYDNKNDPHNVFSSKREIECPLCDNKIADSRDKEIFEKRIKHKYIHTDCFLVKLCEEIMDDDYWKSWKTKEGNNCEESKCCR